MHIQFAELPVFDQERAKAFYVDNLGCEVVADEPMGEDGWRWIELGFPGARTTLHFHPRPHDRPSEGHDLVLMDDDVAARVEQLRRRGVEIVAEPAETPFAPGGVGAEFRDSEGNRIVISAL